MPNRNFRSREELRERDLKVAAIAVLVCAIIGVIALVQGSALGVVIVGSLVAALIMNQVGNPGTDSAFRGAVFRSPSQDSRTIRFAASDKGMVIILTAIILAMILVGAIIQPA